MAFLVLFLVLALTDWVAVARGSTALEYFAKPAALAALLGYAATGSSPSGWLITALGFSLLGDVLLMLPADLFAGGLAAFLLAHVAYIADLKATLGARLLWFVVVVVVSSPLAARILRSVPSGALRGAVGFYIGIISFMVASAIATGHAWAAVGAALFFVSDGIIAWNRFVGPTPWARPAIMITYHLGQLGLTIALRSA